MSQILTIKGLSQVAQAIEERLSQLSSAGGRRAVTAGARQLVQAVRASVPKDTGTLAQSISAGSVKKLGGKAQGNGRRGKIGGVLFSAVGPRRKWAKGEKKPSKYAHLVHNGHINPDGSYTPGRPFMDQAYQATKAQVVETVIHTLEASA